MKKILPTISIRYGASHDDVVVDGQTFTRHELSRPQQGKLRRLIVGALESVGYFIKGTRK